MCVDPFIKISSKSIKNAIADHNPSIIKRGFVLLVIYCKLQFSSLLLSPYMYVYMKLFVISFDLHV